MLAQQTQACQALASLSGAKHWVILLSRNCIVRMALLSYQ